MHVSEGVPTTSGEEKIEIYSLQRSVRDCFADNLEEEKDDFGPRLIFVILTFCKMKQSISLYQPLRCTSTSQRSMRGVAVTFGPLAKILLDEAKTLYGTTCTEASARIRTSKQSISI